MAMFNVQRAITPKVGKPQLWFMCSACCLIVLYTCVKFRENISNGFQLTERTQVHSRNDYVQCSCSVCCLKVLYICVKFGENISDGIRVTKRTRMMEALTDGWTLKLSDGIT